MFVAIIQLQKWTKKLVVKLLEEHGVMVNVNLAHPIKAIALKVNAVVLLDGMVSMIYVVNILLQILIVVTIRIKRYVMESVNVGQLKLALTKNAVLTKNYHQMERSVAHLLKKIFPVRHEAVMVVG